MSNQSFAKEPAADSPSRVLPPARVRVRTTGPFPSPSPAAESEENGHPVPRGYDVGYGKPPRHTRFQPGRSGNPRGRPKSAKGLNTIVRETLTQKVAVRTASGERKISRIEAVLQKTVEQAMKGNPRALAELIKLYGNAVPDEKPTGAAANETPEDLSAADLAILAALRSELAGEGNAK
jgi:hypothetical protein